MDTWRLLLHPPSSAAWNMAVDEAVADGCRQGLSPPTLRVYGWDRPSISLGYFQRPDEVVDLDRCRDAGVPVVRRTTGGGAVYHDAEVTYSVVAPIPHSLFPSTIKGTYEIIARVLSHALDGLGVPVSRHPTAPRPARRGTGSPFCFDSTSRYEITLDGKKVVGSAQRRWRNAFLQHGSILLAHDSATAARWFRGAASDPSASRGLNATDGTVTFDDVQCALITEWERTLGVTPRIGALSPEEATVVAETSHSRDLAVTLVA